MSRRILCPDCNEKRKAKYPSGLHPEDRAAGFQVRVVLIEVKKPEQHGIDVYEGNSLSAMALTKHEELPAIMCDDCNQAIPDGTRAYAISMWRGGEMGAWEQEFGKVV